MKNLVHTIFICLLGISLSAQDFAIPVPKSHESSPQIYRMQKVWEKYDHDQAVQVLARYGYFLENDSIRFVLIQRDKRSAPQNARWKQAGILIHKAYGSLHSARCHIEDLFALPPDFYQEYYLDFSRIETASDNQELMHTDSYETGDSTDPSAGEGLKIAILDLGYSKWTALNQAYPGVYLPNINTFVRCEDSTCTEYVLSSSTQYSDHGTWVTQVVYDHAPAAEYKIYAVRVKADDVAAIEHAQNIFGADIIVRSLANFSNGWDDDSGYMCDVVGDFVADDRLFFNSAGNYHNQHLQSSFVDSDHDGSHNWSANTNRTTFKLRPWKTCIIHTQWEGDDEDAYDFKLWDESRDTLLVDGDGDNGFHFAYYENQSSDTAILSLEMIATDPATAPEFESFVLRSSDLENKSTYNQTISPANCDDPRILDVAAVNEEDYDTSNPPTAIYSSYGPSNGGNHTIDIAAPTESIVHWIGESSTGEDSLRTFLFNGTSCAAPNAAGAAAAFWSLYDDMSASQVAQYLRSVAQHDKDWGDAGIDDIYGSGGCVLTQYDPDNIFVDQSQGVDDEIPEGEVYPWYSLKDINDLGPSDKRVILLTDDEETQALITKPMLITSPNTGKSKVH